MTAASPTLVVALDEDRGIGRDGRLAWHHPSDLRRFRRDTMGRTLVVGRMTLLSLPGPLPGRRLVVVGREPVHGLHGSVQVSSLDEALELPREGGAVVAGGAQLYAEALPRAGVILATRIPGSHGCDRHFPAFEDDGWDLGESEPGEGGITFERWVRRP